MSAPEYRPSHPEGIIEQHIAKHPELRAGEAMARALAAPDHQWPKQTRENIDAFRRRRAAELARTHHEWCDFRESVEAGEPERGCDCWLEAPPCCGQPDTCERDCPLDGESHGQ